MGRKESIMDIYMDIYKEQMAQELPQLFDGAMGTLYAQSTGMSSDLVEAANAMNPEAIRSIHGRYLEAGAQCLLTNTFALPLVESEMALPLVPAAVNNAREAMAEAGCTVPLYASLGPADSGHPERMLSLVDAFAACGVNRFLFETQAEFAPLRPAIDRIRETVPGAQIVVSFAVEADGLTRAGLEVQPLFEEATPLVDGLGLNCLQGPAGMVKLVESLHWDRPLVVRPNAGSPSVTGHRMTFTAQPDYFAQVLAPLCARGISVGGCCGTTPEHIQALSRYLNQADWQQDDLPEPEKDAGFVKRCPDNAVMALFERESKPMFVEADPPATDDVLPWLAAVKRLKNAGADVITVSDNPVGRPRADSCMLSALAASQEDMLMLPHIACRDKNRNAIRSLVTGLSAFGVHQCLVVTGDPVCEEDRSEVRQVYNFNSRRLAAYIQVLNETVLQTPMCVMGALNVNARTFDIQLRLAKEKIANGVQVLLTQPVLSERGLENLKRAHEELDCRILAGIFPVVSERNALYLQNEVSGIELDERIPGLYAGLNREESEDLALRLSLDVMRAVDAYCDGWYIMMPFRRTQLVARIMGAATDTDMG